MSDPHIYGRRLNSDMLGGGIAALAERLKQKRADRAEQAAFADEQAQQEQARKRAAFEAFRNNTGRVDISSSIDKD